MAADAPSLRSCAMRHPEGGDPRRICALAEKAGSFFALAGLILFGFYYFVAYFGYIIVNYSYNIIILDYKIIKVNYIIVRNSLQNSIFGAT